MKNGIGRIDADMHRIENLDFPEELQMAVAPVERTCRVCGCTDSDARQCIEAQGYACHWVADNLCSRCEDLELFS